MVAEIDMQDYWVRFKPTQQNILKFIRMITELNDFTISIRCFHKGTKTSVWAVKMNSIHVGIFKLNGFEIELVPMVVLK